MPDVVFSALPHLKSAEFCAPFLNKSVVIDLSADFRIHDPNVFQTAYNHAVPRPDLLEKAVYGLAEWYGKEIKSADLIAAPGCYPTASLLPLLPFYKEKLIDGTPVINALSGIPTLRYSRMRGGKKGEGIPSVCLKDGKYLRLCSRYESSACIRDSAGNPACLRG